MQSEEDDDVTLVENTFVEDDEYDYQASSVLGSTREGEERFGTKDDGDDDDDKQKSLRQRAFIFIFFFFFFFFVATTTTHRHHRLASKALISRHEDGLDRIVF